MAASAVVSIECDALPVKNTFIHFDAPSEEAATRPAGARRMLRRGHSDPHSYAPLYSLRADPCKAIAEPASGDTDDRIRGPISDFRAPELALVEVQSCSGDSTAPSTPESGPIGERDAPAVFPIELQSSSGDDNTPVHTPEHTPRHWALSVAGSTPDGADVQSLEQMCAADAAEAAPLPREAPIPRLHEMPSCIPLGSRQLGLAATVPVVPNVKVVRSFAADTSDPCKTAQRMPAVPRLDIPTCPSAAQIAADASDPHKAPAVPRQYLQTRFPSAQTATDTSDPYKAGFVFSFTLRLADATGLGIDVQSSACGTHLTIQQILQQGAIEAWNRQCLDGSSYCMKVVLPGDLIVGINSASDCARMLQECRDKYLLKLRLVRPCGERSRPELHAWSQPDRGYSGGSLGFCMHAGWHQNYNEGDRLHSCKLPVVI